MIEAVVVFAHGFKGGSRQPGDPRRHRRAVIVRERRLSGVPARLVERGIRSIRMIPYCLTSGTHMERDLPRVL